MVTMTTLTERQPPADRTSALAGGAASLRHVLGEGLISNGPLASATTAVVAAAAYGGGALPLTVFCGALIALTWINTPYQFADRISSAGGIFAFVRQAIGDRWGYSASVGYFFYYVLLVPGSALGIVGVFEYVAAGFGVTLPGWTWIAVLLVTTIPPFALAWFRLTPSLAYGAVTAAIEAVVIVALAVALIVHAGGHNTAAVFTDPHLATGGWKGVLIGMAIASTALGGPDAVVFLGEEARSPRSTIRKALLIGQFSVSGLYLLYSYAVTVGWGPTRMASFLDAPAPGLALLGGIAGKAAVLIVALLILNSIIGVNLAVNLTASRMLFDHARSGLAPAALARLRPRTLSPGAALAAVLVVELAAGVAVQEIWGGTEAFLMLYAAATAGGVFCFVIADVALMVFARREGLRRPLGTVLLPLASLALLAVSVYGNFFPVTFPAAIAPIGILALMAAGFAWAVWAVRRRRSAR
jgi:amino acid transporter